MGIAAPEREAQPTAARSLQGKTKANAEKSTITKTKMRNFQKFFSSYVSEAQTEGLHV